MAQKLDADGLYTGRKGDKGPRMVAIAETVEQAKTPREKLNAALREAIADMRQALATRDIEDVIDAVDTFERNQEAWVTMVLGPGGGRK